MKKTELRVQRFVDVMKEDVKLVGVERRRCRGRRGQRQADGDWQTADRESSRECEGYKLHSSCTKPLVCICKSNCTLVVFPPHAGWIYLHLRCRRCSHTQRLRGLRRQHQHIHESGGSTNRTQLFSQVSSCVQKQAGAERRHCCS